MKIKQILSTHRFDFTATMVCEHCGHEEHLRSGYNDRNYHDNVIPKMPCESCHKDRGDLVADNSQEANLGMTLDSARDHGLVP